jgi:hypothetical protein
MFCPRQLFRVVNRCRPPRWLSTVQHDSADVLHDPQSIPATHTIQHDSSNPQLLMTVPTHTEITTVQHESSNISDKVKNNTNSNIAMQILNAAKEQKYSVCFRIAYKMKANGMKPDVSIYNGLMSAIAGNGNRHALLAWSILDDMLLEGIQPTVTTFLHLIRVIMTPFHFQVSPLTGISRRKVNLPVDICGVYWRQ